MSRKNRVRKLINLGTQKEMVSKRESGESVGDLSAENGVAKSTISTVRSGREGVCGGPQERAVI
jgi:hypothetical protein